VTAKKIGRKNIFLPFRNFLELTGNTTINVGKYNQSSGQNLNNQVFPEIRLSVVTTSEISSSV